MNQQAMDKLIDRTVDTLVDAGLSEEVIYGRIKNAILGVMLDGLTHSLGREDQGFLNAVSDVVAKQMSKAQALAGISPPSVPAMPVISGITVTVDDGTVEIVST